MYAFKCQKRLLLYIVTYLGQVFVLDPHLKAQLATYQLDLGNSKLINAYADTSDEGFIAITSDFKVFKSNISMNHAESKLKSALSHDEKYLNELLLSGKCLEII